MINDFLDRHDKMQRLNNKYDYCTNSFTRKPTDMFTLITTGCLGAVVGIMIMAGVKSCDKPNPVIDTKCSACHNKQTAMMSYFAKRGVDNPSNLATAVLKTKRPRLMAAIAVKESPRQLAGDGGKSKGYFQVQEYHWKHLLTEKKVSKDATTQALDSERILDALVEEKGSLKKGLNAYGGSTTGRYSKMILAELVSVPK